MDLEKPSIIWDGSIPRSRTFNDIYYSPENGLAESTYVFIKNNFLETRFDKLNEHSFCIAETGFGTGLNFLATCQLWSSKKKQDTHLDFISFEKYPLTIDDLTKALLPFQELATFSEQLIQMYPKLITGFHRLHFTSNISLTLYFGDALEGLTKLSLQSKVDAWYFDGFSPKENEILWSEELFNACKQFNKEDTTFATFTSAGHVRRKLTNAGFICEKVKGFGVKREMLRGKFKNKNQTTSQLTYAEKLPYSEKPWLRCFNLKKNYPQNVAIIGAGLAGAWTAYKLANKGIMVDVYDSANEIAAGASGNPRGATYFKLNKDSHSENNFYLNAYLYAIRELDRLQLDKSIWDKSGLIQLLTDDGQEPNLNFFTSKLAKILTQKECESISGYPQNYAGIYFPDAGNVNPKALCEFLLNHNNINLKLNFTINHLVFNDKTSHWIINSDNEKKEYSKLLIANSYNAQQFEQCAQLPLYQVRGQSTQLAANTDTKKLKTVICSKGYLTPAINQQHTIGSTFDPRNKSTEITEEDNQVNLNYLKKFTPDFYKNLKDINILSAKAALRCQTPDMLPIVGMLPDYQQFIIDYAEISKGQLKKDYPVVKYLPNLFINVAHASRGLISTPYCAEIIASQICGEIAPCEQDILDNLASARFYMRSLKKQK